MIKAIIFDCFGVVVSDTFDALIDDLNLSKSDVEKISSLLDKSNKGTIAPEEYRAAAAKIVNLPVEEYTERMRRNVKNYQLLSYIEELRKSYKVAMLSNVGSRDSLESRFDKGELERRFDVVVASAEIGFAKPEAQAYEITASDLGVLLRECVMIDDREQYCDGARGVGMKAILYQTFEGMKKELEQILSNA